jgi:hypothetical protein
MTAPKITVPSPRLVLAKKTQSLAGDSVEGCVYHTYDLIQFTLFKENRPIRPRAVSSMVKSIEELNLLKHSPMIVTSEGGIVDGQTRWSAVAEMQGKGARIGIYYTVLDADVDPYEAMRMVNATSSPWTNADYLYHNYARDISPYREVYLKWVQKKHEGLHLSTAAVLEVYGIKKQRLKDGTPFEIEDIDDLHAALNEVQSIQTACAGFTEICEAKTLAAYMRARKHPNFSFDQIVHFYNHYPGMLSTRRAELKSANPNHRLDVLVWMHNYRRSKSAYKIKATLL